VSAACAIIEYVFEYEGLLSGAAVLVERMCAAVRAENRAVGQRLAAIGELDVLRLRQVGERQTWCTDTQEAVAAALQVSHGLANLHRLAGADNIAEACRLTAFNPDRNIQLLTNHQISRSQAC
jgi:hypothetical protein